MAAELENDRWENVRKLTQAHDVSARTVYDALMRTVKLSKKSARCVNKRFSLEMKKERFRTYEAAEAMAGGRDSLTVWDNVLTVWEAAGGEERAGRPHSRSGGLL